MTLLRKFTCLVVAAALGLGLALPTTAQAGDPKEMLKFVPQDCWGFVMLQSMETLDEKLTQIQKIVPMEGVPPSITPMMLMPLGITPQENPIDMKAPVGVVMLDSNKFGGGDYTKSIVALVPVKDGKALVTKLGGGEPADGVITCKSPMGEDMFAVIRDSYVLLGQNQDALKAAAKPEKTMGDDVIEARGSLLKTSDIYVSVSVRTLVAAHKDMIMGMLPMLAAGAGGDVKSLEQLLQMFMEMESFDMSVRLDEAGLAMRFLNIPKKGSDLEKLMLDTKNSSESLLAVLPQEKYLFAIGSTGGYSEHAAKFGDQNILGTVLKSAQLPGLDETAVKTIDGEIQKMFKSLGPWAASISGMPEGKDGLFGATVALESKDPAEFVNSIRTIYETVWKVSDDEDIEELKKNIVHAKEAETIDGNKVDTVTVKLDGLAELAAMDPDDLKNAQSLLGKEIVFRFGVVGDKHVVFAFGGGKDRYQTICQSVKTKSSNSLRHDKGIGEISKVLPNPHSAEGYFAVDNILTTIKSALKATGEEDDIPEVPVMNAPVAIGAAQIGSVQRMDFFVPMKVIEAVKSMVMESMKADMNAFDEGEEEDEVDAEGESSEEE